MTKSLKKSVSRVSISKIGAKTPQQGKQVAKKGIISITRRSYISWSAMNLLERDENAYIRQYIQGEQGFVNEAMSFGKTVADALQYEKSDDPYIRQIITLLPRFETSEKKLIAKYKKMSLLGYLDSTKESLAEFREYKTGRTPWTQSKVDSHGQLVFYAMIIFLLTKKIPVAYLDWMPTEYGEEIKLTGEIKTFVRKPVTLSDISQMLKRVEDASERIDNLWKLQSDN